MMISLLRINKKSSIENSIYDIESNNKNDSAFDMKKYRRKRKGISIKTIIVLILTLVSLIFATLLLLGAFGFLGNIPSEYHGDHDLESIILEGLPPRQKRDKESDKKRIDFLHHHHQHHHEISNNKNKKSLLHSR